MHPLRPSITLGWRVALAILLLTFAPVRGTAQNVSAHYANGQVWVVWDVEPAVLTTCVSNVTYAASNNVVISVTNCVPVTYAIWFSPQPVTNTPTATLVGRLFQQEWAATILTGEIKDTFGVKPMGFRIPDGLGGYRTLATNQGVFVHTVRSNFTGYYAVRPFGATNVPANYRTGPVTTIFSTNDPPACHSQASGQKNSYPIEWFTMWADGDNSPAAARPDFPLMANAAKRGAPHSFFVMGPKTGGIPATNIPACIALHSGDAKANMWLPGQNGFMNVGVAPQGGYVVALEDKNVILTDGLPDSVNSRWLGWVPSFDPFTDLLGNPNGPLPWTNNLPASNEVVQTYTLNRLNWTLDWLIVQRAIDPDRVSVLGHSGGSMGGLLWSHAYPHRFASANLYGTGLGDYPNTPFAWKMHGTRDQNLATTLTNRAGTPVHTRDVVELNASLSPLRDTPFTRIFIGKREENWVVDDDRDYRSDVIANFRLADTRGPGVAMFWDLRRHGVEAWTFDFLTNALANPPNCGNNATVDISGSWGYNDLWVPTFTNQFTRDDVAFQTRYQAAQSYPAFFNFQAHGGHGDMGEVTYTNSVTMTLPAPFDLTSPYDGLVTTTECRPPWNGDRRGTWGGYFDWETNLVDTATNWSAVLFLVGANSAFNPVEICPNAARVADVAIRRPQQFIPLPGAGFLWTTTATNSNAILQSGVGVVDTNGLVTLTGVNVRRDPDRAVLQVNTPPILTVNRTNATQVLLSAYFYAGFNHQLQRSTNLVSWLDLGAPTAGSNAVVTVPRNIGQAQEFYRLRISP